MIPTAVANRYASALVDVVTGPNSQAKPQDVLAQLQSFEQTVAGSHELHTALISPAIPPARKRAVIGRIADQLRFTRVTRNFLFILIDHRRIDGIRQITDSFDVLLDERLGFARADVRSAQPLNDQQRSALVAELARLSGRQIRPRFTVDPELIGGVVARIGSTVYDGSLRGQLRTLGERLSAE